jgi:hypothetical protein
VASLGILGGVETVLRTGSILTLHPSEGRVGCRTATYTQTFRINDFPGLSCPAITQSNLE